MYSAKAATFDVTAFHDPLMNGCDVGSCSLREAITDANALPGFHTINLPPGDYQVSEGQIEVNAPDGISIFGAGDWQTSIDANHWSRIFNVSNTTLQVFNVTLKNGRTVDQGGAILAQGSNLAIIESTLINNEANLGGAIFAIENNSGDNNGNGFVLRRSQINENTGAIASSLYCGNGLYCHIDESTFDSNISTDTNGSAVVLLAGSPLVTVKRSTISNNTVFVGTLYIADVEDVVIENNTISGHSSDVISTSLFLLNVNDAELTSNTLANNQYMGNDFLLYVQNSTVAYQQNIFNNPCQYTTDVNASSDGFNITQDDSCFLPTQSDFSDVTTGQLNLLPLADNYGITQTHALGPSSRARYFQTTSCDGADQRGIARTDPRCDVGSFQSTPYCSSPAMAIPDFSPAGITDVINISEISTITDLDVLVDISHTYVNDLKVTLTHSVSGLEVTLANNLQNGASSTSCNGDDLIMIFDQDEIFYEVEGSCMRYDSSDNGDPSFPGNFVRFRPDAEGGNLLEVYDGESLAGNWSLKIVDSANVDIGILNHWCVLPDIDFIFVDEIFYSGFE